MAVGIKTVLARMIAALSRRPLSGEPEMDLDALYQEYSDMCRDRGVFAKSRASLHGNDEADWLIYATALIASLPSREERQTTFEEGYPRGPGRKSQL